jgi:hypothetical protein
MRAAVLIVLALALPLPSQAIDLTGTWEGKYTCKGFEGEKFSFTVVGTLEITQTGAELALRVPFDGGADEYNGVAIDDARKPETAGAAYFVHCGTSEDPGTGLEGFDETGFAKLKTNASGGGSFKATTNAFFSEPPIGAGNCKFSFKRTSTVDPVVPACPVAP